MSTDGGGSRRSATQIAALLLAVAPLVTGIYQESRENQNRRADARASRETALQEQRAADESADEKAAKELATTLLQLDDGSAKTDRAFCNHIYLALSRLDSEARSPRTANLIRASLLLRNSADTRPRVCGCSNAGGIGRGWLKSFSAVRKDARTDESNPVLLEALGGAALDCDASTCAAASLRTNQSCKDATDLSPQCVAAREQRDKLCAVDASSENLRVRSLESQLAIARADLQQLRARPAKCPSQGECLLLGVPKAGSLVQPVSNVFPEPDLPAGGLDAGCAIAKPVGKERRRVFIQVPDAVSRSLAETFREAVNAQPPFKSPGIEVMGESRSPNRLQIRYAYSRDLDSATKLKNALDSGRCGYPVSEKGLAQLYPMPHLQGRTDPGVLEVWWPRN